MRHELRVVLTLLPRIGLLILSAYLLSDVFKVKLSSSVLASVMITDFVVGVVRLLVWHANEPEPLHVILLSALLQLYILYTVMLWIRNTNRHEQMPSLHSSIIGCQVGTVAVACVCWFWTQMAGKSNVVSHKDDHYVSQEHVSTRLGFLSHSQYLPIRYSYQ